MNTYEKLNRLGDIISELAELYGQLSEELPQLHFVGAPAPAKSEVKKIAVKLFRFIGRRRTIYR